MNIKIINEIFFTLNNSQIVDAVMSATMLCVHVCPVLLERHHNVDLNVLVHPNVHQHLLVAIKNVLIHAPERVEWVQDVKLSTIHRYVAVIQVKRVIHSEAVNRFRFHHRMSETIHVY